MKIFCTNGLKSVLIELAPALEREHAISLSTTWGATVGLAREIAGGAQADLAILTGEVVDDLIARGKAVAGSRVDLARSGIGVAVC